MEIQSDILEEINLWSRSCLSIHRFVKYINARPCIKLPVRKYPPHRVPHIESDGHGKFYRFRLMSMMVGGVTLIVVTLTTIAVYQTLNLESEYQDFSAVHVYHLVSLKRHNEANNKLHEIFDRTKYSQGYSSMTNHHDQNKATIIFEFLV